DSDSAHHSGDTVDAGVVHLRDQRADVLARRLVRSGIPRRGLLVGIFRSDPVQHHLVGAFCAPAPEARLTLSMPQSERIFSFEFFPPATPEGVAKLRTTREQLARLGPKFFSVTYGAGGSTRDRTLETVLEIKAAGHSAAPHISCIGSTQQSVHKTLATYREHGIGHLVALRGDLPSGSADVGEFRYANELVDFIRAATGDWFHVEVAAYPEYHPQCRTPEDDLATFKRKIDSFGDDSASSRAFGLDVVTDLCADLLAHGAPGLHFYTLNQASLTKSIWQRLRLS